MNRYAIRGALALAYIFGSIAAFAQSNGSTVATNAAIVWRDWTVDGVPSSGPWNPRKPDIRAWGALVGGQLNSLQGAQVGGTLAFDTKANLDATLTYPANSMAFVFADATAANNGVYRKSGASGSGSWAKVSALIYGPQPVFSVAGSFTTNPALASVSIGGPAASPLISFTVPRGTLIHSTSGAPAGSLGVDGDYAIDAATYALYGPKAAGAWPAASATAQSAAATAGASASAAATSATNAAASATAAAASATSAAASASAAAVSAGGHIGIWTLPAQEAAGFIVFNHRNSPTTYPEETLVGMRASVAAGARNIEFDVFRLLDGSLAVMHDNTIDRTTTGSGLTANQTASSWVGLVADASSFLGGGWADTTVPLFEDVLREFGNKVLLMPEAKNAGSGAAIVAALQKYRISPDMVLIQSFDPAELTAGLAAGYPTMLVFSSYDGTPTPAALKATGYRWIGFASASAPNMAALRAQGLKLATYTYNQRTPINALLSSTDGVYSSDALYTSGLTRRASDPFSSQRWYPGHQASNPAVGANAGRGQFVGPAAWRINTAAGNDHAGSLMGWANPLGGGGALSGTWNVNSTIVIDSTFAADRFAWMGMFDRDTPYSTDGSGVVISGYICIFRANGGLEVYRRDGTLTTMLNQVGTTALSPGTGVAVRLTVTPTDVTCTRVDTGVSATAADTTYRFGATSAWLHAGSKGADVYYFNMSVANP